MILIKNKAFSRIEKRFMFNGWKPPSLSSLGNKLFRIKGNTVQKADMGRCSAVKYKKGEVVKPDGSPIDAHEENHYSIYDKETGELIALLTSSKNGSFRLSPIKLDGTFIETKDAEWNPIPHPEKGGQFIRFYKTIRVVNNNQITEYAPGTLYLENHERKIRYLQEKENTDSLPREDRKTHEEYFATVNVQKGSLKNNENNDENI